ncbi:bifunctional cytochrome P450/NADPH--P450 reductase [Allokutzneria sp. NRRL B-24872]|uniref:bifunctional cytochrome P450/NADPH--P450 reductase n=1 Tax=Allokutzneria sp. NRRL B-24872 TaxID=1137961 RepID=UPI000A38C999|nr:cytochrome P450 [Allokutzneria sp. NRRL B-24872]
MTVPIPEGPALPLVGHLFSLLGKDQLTSSMEQARELGPIFRVRVPGNEVVIVSGAELVAELSDDTRFRKNVHTELENLRDIGGDGLFTAYNDEPNWRKAHDILMPAFSLGAMRGYHSAMLSVARTLVAKWDRAEHVDVAADMTRLTFDTIGLCGFGQTFDSFASEEPHPFVASLSDALAHAQAQSTALPGAKYFQREKGRKYQADLRLMREVVDGVIRRRREAGDERTDDLLGRMLHTTDEVTGQPLDDVNIRYQTITFLIAGHETTSGALSFALYYLAKHPEVLAKAQAEVDELWGEDPDRTPEFADVGKLRYLRQVLNEAMRLWPTAPAYGVEPLQDTVIGGKYSVRKGQTLLVLIPQLHRDPAWGDNVELFDPSRFAPELEDSRPVHLYKPFGSGERACIGRQFALHEALLVLGLVVHRYRLVDHANYQLKIKNTLTIKPDGFTLRLRRRTPAKRQSAPVKHAESTAVATASGRLTVLYGSNLGTCKEIAKDLAEQGADRGYTTTIAPLNDAVGKLEGPVLITTASYNGKPTDDAAQFVEWLGTLEPGSLAGLEYALLGVGDRNWASTYQRIPTLIDERLTAAGASALLRRGAANASGDFASDVNGWTDELWRTLAPGSTKDSGPLYMVEDGPESVVGDIANRLGLSSMEVVVAEDLVDLDHPLARAKRLIRLRLPDGVSYRTGDHLTVLPENPAELVATAAKRFDLDLDHRIRLRTTGKGRAALPVGRSMSVRELLTHCVELQEPATAEQVRVLAEHTQCPPERSALAAGRTVLDLLVENASCELPFALFLELLPALRPRHYSISSSALADPGTVDLMVSLLTGPHRDGDGQFTGIASHYLHSVKAGDLLQARVSPCREAFRLPQDPATPVIMVSAGTGLAPFRGAIADRAHSGQHGNLLCYFGCDHPDVDYLHRAELEAAEAAGAVSLRPAFSQTEKRFVQDRITAEGEEVLSLLDAGGRVYVCGDGRNMAPAVRAAFLALHKEKTGASPEEAEAWLASLTDSGRYVEDVWVG